MKDVSASYGGERVLDRVNVNISPCRYVGIIGPNGGGKTTLLKLLLGFLQPLEGSVKVFGQKPTLSLSKIGYVPQLVSFDDHFPVRVLDVVLMGRLGRHWRTSYNKEDYSIVHNVLDQVSLSDQVDQPIGQLSGGEKQRVFLARALASQPELLLLDEPTSSIDSRIEQDFYALLKKLNQNMAIILVSHDVGVIAKEVSDVICVNRGVTMHNAKTIARESLTELYDNPVKCVDHHCHL
jgi:zinc transport system ATP-binding protein